jgi:gluconokinase
MGVSGCGKSTIARAYAKQHNMQYLDADDFHSSEAKSHMAKGLPLNDDMRIVWIQRMVEQLPALLKKQNCTLAYSGLREAHRKAFLRLDAKVSFLHLVLSIETTVQRVSARSSHFFPAHLVQSQFDSLEPAASDENIIEVNAQQSIEDVIASSHRLLHNA